MVGDLGIMLVTPVVKKVLFELFYESTLEHTQILRSYTPFMSVSGLFTRFRPIHSKTKKADLPTKEAF